MTIEIKLENIGGLLGKYEFKFERGINVVKAPNATGKTSFVKALRAIILPDEVLRNYRHFIHRFRNNGSVLLIFNDKKYARRFVATDDTLSVSGEPLLVEGSVADAFAIAVPDNPLLQRIEKAESLGPLIEEMSGAMYYRILAQKLKEKLEAVLDELSEKKRGIDELNRLQEELDDLNKQLKSAERELASIPPLTPDDKKKFADYWDVRRKNMEAEKLLKKIDSDLKIKHEQLEDLDEGIKNFTNKHPNIDKEIDELERLLSTKNMDYSRAIDAINLISLEIEMARKNREENVRYAEKIEKIHCFACGRSFKSLKELEEHIASLEEARLIHQKTHDKLRKEIEEAEEKIEWLKNQKIEILHRDVNLRDEIDRSIRFLESERKKKEQELKSTSALLEKFVSVPEHVDRYTKLESTIKAQRSLIERTEKDIKALGKVGAEFQVLKRRENFIHHAIAFVEKRAEETMREYTATFNKQIMEVYRILGFKDFHDVRINDTTWMLEIERKYGTQRKDMSLEYLSASERVTIGLILILAGKEQYLREFPLFVLDELTLSYDPTRFERILEYLKKTVPYVIVTALSPMEAGEEIKVTRM